MDLITSVATLTTATKNIVDLGKALNASSKSSEIKALENKFLSMQGETLDSILNAKLLIHQLHDENRKLKKELMKVKAQIEEKQKYTRLEIASGFFAYVQDEPVKPLQDAHKFCSNCYDKGIKSTLETDKISVFDESPTYIFNCNGCGNTTKRSELKP